MSLKLVVFEDVGNRAPATDKATESGNQMSQAIFPHKDGRTVPRGLRGDGKVNVASD